MSVIDENDWWFCLKHMTVEHGPGCPARDRMGPYPTQDEAAHALDTAATRNEQWRRQNEDDDT